MMGKLTAPPPRIPQSRVVPGKRKEGREVNTEGSGGDGVGAGTTSRGSIFLKTLTVRRNAIPVSFEGLTGSGLILHELSC